MQKKESLTMFTQCRGCGEIFQVAVDDLITASAMVRCSSCGAVFNALDTLSDYKPQEEADLILHEHDNPPPLLTHEFKQSIIQNTVATTEAQVDTVENGDEIQFEEVDDASVFAVKPDFVADDETSKSHSTLMWVPLSLLMLAGLIWQASVALQQGSLVLPEGNFKKIVCQQIACYQSNIQLNLNSISLVSRSIRKHPGRDNALIIKTGIINSDEKVQGFPALQVKMSNLNGDIVAMRRFLPHEYMDVETIKAGMPPNTLIPITLELQSPGKSAVTFEVGFSPTYGEM